MNTALRIVCSALVILLLGGWFAVASQEPPKSAAMSRMPAPAANATEGNVQDLTQ